ncbi:hypothetical protein DTO013E5_1704 [Penicillium roqueforti]|nr:uncharacterized protein LCP9604111_2686 [Penicillium roqueforti]KAF9251285.1 hypothetical protein LCP9604111_2686 [Penicillium roqueforti]KAI2678545.1 hypothetical protein CBS147355_4430 [Penicillium roqueforti]KAI2713653.1 hypothetical protein CBS147332_5393 [Penicillium roqueforti]KAI2727693.1 hypothetical protein CBS147354_3366 [Penicillium roqueforti]KAI2745592.1 hypothetical protein DTO012A1_2231 [Penicillium roqueforti]
MNFDQIDTMRQILQQTSVFPPPGTPIKTRGLREVCEVDGRTFFRKRGAQDWTEDTSNPEELKPPAENPHLYLYLVQEEQAPGEPNHWALFLADENEPDYGYVYQVTGDAQDMKYDPSTDKINVVDAGFTANIYTLAVVSEDQARVAKLVKQAAEEELPPQAENRKSVTENCQGWTVRVIARLVKEKIVMPQKLEVARSLMQPVQLFKTFIQEK